MVLLLVEFLVVLEKAIKKSIITAIRGNLIYQKFKFIISANYLVATIDKNINKSLVLY